MTSLSSNLNHSPLKCFLSKALCSADSIEDAVEIAQKYDIKKQRNQIKLTVDYKGMNLTTETEFTFAKQG